MQWLKTTLREIYGLFVDDVPFAGLILLWVAAIWALAAARINAGWLPLLLFAGLAALLVESAMRCARSKRKARSGAARMRE